MDEETKKLYASAIVDIDAKRNTKALSDEVEKILRHLKEDLHYTDDQILQLINSYEYDATFRGV